jgi:hypothetical protein
MILLSIRYNIFLKSSIGRNKEVKRMGDRSGSLIRSKRFEIKFSVLRDKDVLV